MENFDKNGTYVQRRKMYIGLPLHNMKSRVEFDWQNNDVSVQDQVGTKFKLNQEHEQIRKKYTESLDKRIYNKYVEHKDDSYFIPKDLEKSSNTFRPDILTQEVQNFNHSKIISPQVDRKIEGPAEEAPNELQESYTRREKLDHSYERLNQSQNMQANILPSPRNIGQSGYNAYYQPQAMRDRSQTNYRYDRPYNPQNYYTLNPSTDRYKPFQPYPQSYNYDLTVPRGQKHYSGAMASDYPLRNVIPDKLEGHLREKVKADRKKAVKVTLNLFDYNKR